MTHLNSPNFLEIAAALRVKRGYEFEVVCNDYLKARFPKLTPRINTKVNWTVSGTPDAFLFEDSGHLIAFQHGPEETWRTKLSADARSVADLAEEEGITVSLLVFCTAAEIDLPAQASMRREIIGLYGFDLEICDLKRLADDLEKLYPGIAFRRLGIPIKIERFMSIDAYLDSANKRYWPKRKDLNENLLYWPDHYIESVERLLVGSRRCLLAGSSGSGKTALAVAFALRWRSNDVQHRNHPEAIGFYLDASNGYSEQDGEAWYQYVRAHDYQHEIFIIDNCHLSPAAVNAFIYQWELQQPRHALVILISAQKTSESPWEDYSEDYFESFEQAEAVITVHAEAIYKGMLINYSDAFRSRNQELYVPVQTDLDDPERTARIKRVGEHNLTALKGLIDAWSDLGGRLSDVTEEGALNRIAARHLTRRKTQALIPLCCLAQFEIPIHDDFIRSLPQESLSALIEENLIDAENSSKGRFYYLTLHSQVANQIFQAHLWLRKGADYKRSINDEAFNYFKAYLSTQPSNFVNVYRQLKRSGQAQVQRRLLGDREVQDHALYQSSRNLDERITYLSFLHKVEPVRAKDLLKTWIDQEIERFQPQALKLIKTGEADRIITSLIDIDAETVPKIFGGIPYKDIAEFILHLGLKSISRWLDTRDSSLVKKLGYSTEWHQQMLDSLDLITLSSRLKNLNQQQLFWYVWDLAKVNPKVAERLLACLTPSGLIQMIKKRPKGAITALPKIMRVGGPQFKNELLAQLDDEVITVLADQYKYTSIQGIYWLLREFNSDVPEVSDRFLEHITPANLANHFINKRGTAKHLHRLIGYLNQPFKREFKNCLSEDDLLTTLRRSELRHTAYCIYRSPKFKNAYFSFVMEHINDKLTTAKIPDIAKFIFNIKKVPEYGSMLATLTSEAVLRTDLADQLSQSNAEELSLLIYNAHSTNTSYSCRLLDKVMHVTTFDDTLSNSNIRGLQLLLHNTSELAPSLIPDLAQHLQNLELADKISESDPLQVSGFLWKVMACCGEELAQRYCSIIDSQNISEWILHSKMEVLATFLWHLVQMSDREELHTLTNPHIKNRLALEWANNPGVCTSILGVIAVARPGDDFTTYLPTVSSGDEPAKVNKWLLESLEGRHPYVFALTVKGLIAAKKANSLEKLFGTRNRAFNINYCLRLLRKSREQAVTLRSRELLVETITFLENFGHRHSGNNPNQ